MCLLNGGTDAGALLFERGTVLPDSSLGSGAFIYPPLSFLSVWIFLLRLVALI